MIIEIGSKGIAEALVEKEDTAKVVGSGDLLVYATPCMIALMEGAACEAVAPYLAEGESSVGTQISVTHSSATPVGMEVRAEAVLTEVDGRKLRFESKQERDQFYMDNCCRCGPEGCAAQRKEVQTDV